MQGRRWSDGLHQARKREKVWKSRMKTNNGFHHIEETISVYTPNWR
ncbi:hypothetical protein ACNKHW_00670 [Shigella flexneri]